MLERNVDATALSIDAGVQILVETTEYSVWSSPILVDQDVSAVPGLNKWSVDAWPAFGTGCPIPALLEKFITETVASKETPTNQTEPVRHVRGVDYGLTMRIKAAILRGQGLFGAEYPRV
jgi:hypothetical protein